MAIVWLPAASIGHCDSLPFLPIASYSNWTHSYYQKLPKKRGIWKYGVYVCVLNSPESLFCADQCKNNVSITSSRMEYGGKEADFEVCSIKEFGKNVNFVFNQYLEKYCKTLTYGISWTKIVIIFPFFSLTV